MDKKIYRLRYKKFADLLKHERTCLHVTQEEMAAGLGLTQTQVSQIEKGHRKIDIIELIEYCKVSGIPFTEFVNKLKYRLFSEYLDDKNIKDNPLL